MRIVYTTLGVDLVCTGMVRHQGVIKENGKDTKFTLIEKYDEVTDERSFEVKVDNEHSQLNYYIRDITQALHLTVVYRNLYKAKKKSALVDEAVQLKIALIQAVKLLGDTTGYLGNKNIEKDIIKFIDNNKQY